MKKFFAILLIAVMGVGVANAELKFGIKAGVNVNHLSSDKTFLSKNNQAGWTAGLMAEYTVPIIGIGLDLSLMYSYMNTNVAFVVDDDKQYQKNKNFLEIPINLKYKFKLPVVSSFLAPYIFTGPSFGFKLDKNTLQDYKTKTFQAVWNLGLGIELAKHLQIGASYGFGMNNIVKTVVKDVVPVKYHNNYWTITAAYLF